MSQVFSFCRKVSSCLLLCAVTQFVTYCYWKENILMIFLHTLYILHRFMEIKLTQGYPARLYMGPLPNAPPPPMTLVWFWCNIHIVSNIPWALKMQTPGCPVGCSDVDFFCQMKIVLAFITVLKSEAYSWNIIII